MSGDQPPDKIQVVPPGPYYRMGAGESLAWDITGALFERLIADLGPETAFSVIMSRTTRELRRHFGLPGAQQMFRQFAETMQEAAEDDR